MIQAGVTSLLSETTEFIGAEHILAKRARTPEISQKIIDIVKTCEERAKQMNVDIRGSQPTPVTSRGGLVRLKKNPWAAFIKQAILLFRGVLNYGEIPKGQGLYIMDTPGQDIESITGMLAGGATVVVFTTGRGTPTGFPPCPRHQNYGQPGNLFKDG